MVPVPGEAWLTKGLGVNDAGLAILFQFAGSHRRQEGLGPMDARSSCISPAALPGYVPGCFFLVVAGGATACISVVGGGGGEPCSGARPTTHIRQYGALGRGLCLDGRELCVFFFLPPFLPSRRLFPDWDKTLQGEGGRFCFSEDWGLLCRTCDYLLPCRDLLRDGELPTWAENPAGQRASKQIKSIQNPHLAS